MCLPGSSRIVEQRSTNVQLKLFYIENRMGNRASMANKRIQTDVDSTFHAAEQSGLRVAIKGRLLALALLGVWLIFSRGPDRAVDFVLAISIFATLGIFHYMLIGSRYDRNWVKYVFLSIDIILLSSAVALMPPTPEADLPQIFMFKFDVFPFYFVILGVAAFSFSPGLVLWAGLLGAGSWMGAFAWVVSRMESYLDWVDMPANPTREQFLSIFLNEDFAGIGSRVQESVIYVLLAMLIAIVMYRTRQTVRRQLEAERDMTAVSQMFGRFVPQAVADAMIKDKGTLDPVERQATVLFTDIAGFTNLTEAKGPRAIVNILNAYFDAATEVIGKHNGVVTQFQGDAILAIFNVPFEDKAHAQNALDASQELLSRVDKETFAGEKLGIRIGINTGPLIAGNVGGGGRQSYTVHGDAVNLAARLEALNKEYDTTLLVSQSTADLLIDSDLREIGQTEIRGLTEPVSLYTLSNDS